MTLCCLTKCYFDQNTLHHFYCSKMLNLTFMNIMNNVKEMHTHKMKSFDLYIQLI